MSLDADQIAAVESPAAARCADPFAELTDAAACADSAMEARRQWARFDAALVALRKEIVAARRAGWEAGFKLCRTYGDNHIHFQGEQKERQWVKYLETLP